MATVANIAKRLRGMLFYGRKIKIPAGESFLLANDSNVTKFSVDSSGNVVAAGTLAAGATTITGDLTADTATIGNVSAGASSTIVSGLLVADKIQLGSNGVESITATTGGGTTGLIPANASFVVVTSDNADKQISLPAGTVGDVIHILVGTTGCELISAVAADKVNEVTVGATNELALVAESFYTCRYTKSGFWIVTGVTKLGAAEAALVPDSLT